MKTKKIILQLIVLILTTLSCYSQKYQVRMAFIGNSITIGSFLTNPTTECYPAQLSVMLQAKYGDTCLVSNFAVSGRTMLKKGDYPIWNESSFKSAWEYAPNICFICLGTNDSKSWNWKYGDEFLTDYMSMIDTFKLRNPHVKFIVCYPPPAFSSEYSISDSVLIHGVLPAVDSVVKRTGATFIDFRTPLLNSSSLFADGIHPNVAGAKVMATIVYDTLVATNLIHKVDTGYTFVTSIGTSSSLIKVKDSATISWTTVNADTVYLNGKMVEANGSQEVSPASNTIYTVTAKGEKSTDSLKQAQNVYYPELTSLLIDPSKYIMYQGDSALFTLYYYDQNSNSMSDTVISGTWSIIQGDGSLVDVTDTAVTFVGTAKGTSKVQASVGTLTSTATVVVKASTTGIKTQSSNNEVDVFPNPCVSVIHLPIETTAPTTVTFKLYDSKGALHKDKAFNLSTNGKYLLKVNVEDLGTGIYIYKIEFSGKQFTGKISKIAK
jgi:acyl-CoA thioesterase I